MSKHTKGEWRQYAPEIEQEVDENYRRIVSGIRFFDFSKPNDGFGIGGYISEANARLIAAAPNLLEALEELMSIVKIHSKGTNNNFAWAEMDFAKAAIKKAKGE